MLTFTRTRTQTQIIKQAGRQAGAGRHTDRDRQTDSPDSPDRHAYIYTDRQDTSAMLDLVRHLKTLARNGNKLQLSLVRRALIDACLYAPRCQQPDLVCERVFMYVCIYVYMIIG